MAGRHPAPRIRPWCPARPAHRPFTNRRPAASPPSPHPPAPPTDEAPSFGSGSVPAKTFFRNRAIAEFQAPAATGGNGALSYAVSGLPAGLVFDASGTDTNGCPGTQPREFCGTPTAATSGARTVTVTAQDADANRAAGDRGTLTFQVTVLAKPTLTASPTAANPAPFPAPPVV